MVKDESVEHFCPAKHVDFLYSYVKIPVEPEQIKILFSVSDCWSRSNEII